MRFLFKNHIENAMQSLRASRGRTTLTVTGITIGIMGITMIMSLSVSVNKLINQQFSTTKDSVALIRSGLGGNIERSLSQAQNITPLPTLTEYDVQDVAHITQNSAPMSVIHNTITTTNSRVDANKTAIIGTTEKIKDLAELELRDGQFVGQANGVVIGHQLSIDLFGTEYSLGNVLRIQDKPFTVMGVLKPVKQPLTYLGVNFNNSAIVSLDVSKKLTQNIAQIQQIAIKTDGDSSLEKAISDITAKLNQNHHDANDYHIITGKDITATSDAMLLSLSAIMIAVSIISLFVGGISIMNIMLVNVAERQREVGIRKAIGATNRHIIHQFLIESVIIGLAGGIMGYIFGLIGAYTVSTFLPVSPILSWQPAVVSIGAAMLVGIVFGIYPAVRAANRNTIEAMRN